VEIIYPFWFICLQNECSCTAQSKITIEGWWESVLNLAAMTLVLNNYELNSRLEVWLMWYLSCLSKALNSNPSIPEKKRIKLCGVVMWIALISIIKYKKTYKTSPLSDTLIMISFILPHLADICKVSIK
jgi:hypothetical protein